MFPPDSIGASVHPIIAILGILTILGLGLLMQYSEHFSNGNIGADDDNE